MPHAADMPLPAGALAISTGTWLHIVAMGVYAVLVLPIAMLARHRTGLHGAFHAIGLLIVTLGLAAGLAPGSPPYSTETAAHTLGGFALFLALVAASIAGGIGTVAARDDKHACGSLAGAHAQTARALVYIGVPMQMLTGLVALLHLGDERLSGARGALAATIATASLLAAATAYTHMGERVTPSANMPELLRAYSLFAAENTIVLLGGLALVAYALYLDTPAGAMPLALAGAGAVLLGAGTLLTMRASALAARIVPRATVRGIPAIFAAIVAAAAMLPPRNASTYTSAATGTALAAVLLAAILRYVRAVAYMYLPLTGAAVATFLAQRGIEHMYAASSRDTYTTYLVFFIGALVATLLACTIRVCALYGTHNTSEAGAGAGNTASRRRRRNRPLATEIEEFLASEEDLMSDSRRTVSAESVTE